MQKSRHAARSSAVGGSTTAAVFKWIAPDADGRTRTLRQISHRRGERIFAGVFLIFNIPAYHYNILLLPETVLACIQRGIMWPFSHVSVLVS